MAEKTRYVTGDFDQSTIDENDPDGIPELIVHLAPKTPQNASPRPLAVQSKFDYSTFDTETRIVVQQRTSEIRTLMRRSAQDIIDIGQKLIDVKARLGHGNFGLWLSAEFEWSQDTASNFMNVARRFPQIPNGSEFASKALYLLAAPSTPDSARTEALERAESGEPITHSAAQEIVASHKETPPIGYTEVIPAAEIPGTPIPPRDDRNITADGVVLRLQPGERGFCMNCNDYFGAGDWVRIDNDTWQHTCGWRTLDDTILHWTPESPAQPSTPAPTKSTALTALTSSESNEWYTPAHIIEAAREVLSVIHLDPASCELANRTVQAARYFTIETNGLTQSWMGNVWLNPPYGRDEDNQSNVGTWVAKLIDEYQAGHIAEAILLVNACPDRDWFKPLWDHLICFTDKRIRFYSPDPEAKMRPPMGNAIVYFGGNPQGFAEVFQEFGVIACDYSRRGEWA